MNRNILNNKIPSIFSVIIHTNNHYNRAVIGHKEELDIYFEIDLHTVTVINTGSFDQDCVFEGNYENINDLCETINSFK
jgi:hypothetical protein